MDFVVGLPITLSGFDAIWVIIDRLTKAAHFLPSKMTTSMDVLAKLYIKEIVGLHGVPTSIISKRDAVHFSISAVFAESYWDYAVRLIICNQTANQSE